MIDRETCLDALRALIVRADPAELAAAQDSPQRFILRDDGPERRTAVLDGLRAELPCETRAGSRSREQPSHGLPRDDRADAHLGRGHDGVTRRRRPNARGIAPSSFEARMPRVARQMPMLAAPAAAACGTVAPFRNAIAMAIDMVSMASARSCP